MTRKNIFSVTLHVKQLSILLLIIGLYACNNASKQDANTKLTDSSALKDSKKNASAPPVLIFNPAHGKPGHDCAIAEGAPLNRSQKTEIKEVPTNANASIPTTVAVVSPTTLPAKAVSNQSAGLNPAHGEKNHRCDIAVGAPLNSKPSTTTKPVVLPQSESKTLEVKSSLKINPAHGISGHKCELAVGAPLT